VIDELATDLARARQAIDESGELPWQVRWPIRQRLLAAGAWQPVELTSARHVLPVWSASYSERLPFDVIYLAELAASDPSAHERLEMAMTDLAILIDVHIDEANGDPILLASVIAGWAAMCAGASVLGRNDDAPPNELDGDPYAWSGSFAASVAAAGGATWEIGVGSPARRRAYWLWWLDEAIPDALAPVS
jgi:hypothetical protein